MRFKRTATLVAALAAISLTAGTAAADQISNDIDTTVDAQAETMPLTVGGANGTTQLYVIPRNGDGKNGCNLTGSTSLSINVSSSNTAVATVSPSSVTFTSCSDTRTLTVTPHTTGSANITAALGSNNTGGTFDLAPVEFKVSVTPPPNTPPTVSVAGVTGGASYNKGAVPAATCQVTDAEDGNSSFPATLSPISGPYAIDGIGEQTASCTYTDGGGLTAEASEVYGIVDPSPPAISYTLDPSTPDGDNGWYRSDVTLTWTVTEPQSPSSLATTGCVNQNITVDQAATSYSCSASSAGGAATPEQVSIKRDTTAPSVSYDSATGTLGANGWYTSDVTAKFVATDALSGPATPSKTVTSSGEGTSVTLTSPEFSDLAGNTTAAGADTQTFKIDKTPPSTPTFSGEINNGDSFYFGSVPAAPTCNATDAISGATCAVTGDTNPAAVGSHSYTATATNGAGLTSTATLAYTVLAWDFRGFYQPVDMSTATSTVYNTIKGGSTVPIKFELFAGTRELTDTANVNTLSAKTASCTSSATVDDVEVTATGGTSLRYDLTGGQYIYNWQTPKTAGACYAVTVSSKDGSSKTAYFRTK